MLYTDGEGWPKILRKRLPRNRPFLDAAIDGAGGDMFNSVWRLFVSYGMTSMGQQTLPMQAVIKNIEPKGSTMGSRREFIEMVRFVNEKRIRLVVDRVVHDIYNLEAINELFDDLKEGRQFGKLVVEIGTSHK